MSRHLLARWGVVALVVFAAGCRSVDPTPSGSLPGTTWVAEEIDGRGVLEGVESTLAFDNSRIAGQAGCNRYFGTLELGDGTIRLKPAGTTRMACPEPIMEQETRFLAALGAATTFRRERGKLLLLDEGGGVRARLAPRAPKSGNVAPTEVATFDCDGGLGFVMAPPTGGTGTSDAVDLVLPDRRQRLARVPAASGARYAAGGISVWNKGREAILDLQGQVYKCREATLR